MGFSQDYSFSRRFWALTGVNGALQLGANYRYQAGYSNEIYNYQKSSQFSAGLRLNTTSYFFHPNLVTLSVGGEYNPWLGKDLFLVIPDQSELVTVKKWDAIINFFNQKPVNFSFFYHYDDVYANRENLSNIRSNTTNFGGNFSWSNNILPVQASYLQGKWYETELLTGRTFATLQKNYQVRIDRSFSTYSNNQIQYYHNDYSREDAEIAVRTQNISDNLCMNNTVFFDKKHDYSFISLLSGINQWGTDTYRRYQADESVNMSLPKRFTLGLSYNYYDYIRGIQAIRQNSFHAILQHQLYESLHTGLSLEYNGIHQSSYTETNPRAGIDVNYEKKIFLKGKLMLGCMYNWQRQQHKGEETPLQVMREEHYLTDGQLTLLNKPFVNINTVRVTDATGTIIYQANFDYVLLVRNDYLEIQRVPGGQIPDKSTVYVDYLVMLPGSYKYDVTFKRISASVSLFGRLLEVYFKLGNQTYSGQSTTDYLTLNYFTQTDYGFKLEYKFASGGAEYEQYKSTIVPYNLLRYWLQVQGIIASKVSYSLSGNMRSYDLTADNTRQQFIDMIGNLGYQISPQTNVSVELGYRKQVGQQIGLDLLTGKIQFATVFRQISIKVGMDVYQRDYLHERTNYLGGFIQITRNFNWTRK